MPIRISRTPAEIARHKIGTSMLRVLYRTVNSELIRKGAPRKGIGKILPTVRSVYEAKEQLVKDFMAGKKSAEELAKHNGLFTPTEISKLRNLFLEESQIRVSMGRKYLHSAAVKKSEKDARANIRSLINIGEEILERKINTVAALEERLKETGLSKLKKLPLNWFDAVSHRRGWETMLRKDLKYLKGRLKRKMGYGESKTYNLNQAKDFSHF